MAKDIHVYLNNEFKETIESLDAVTLELEKIDLKEKPELVYFAQLMDNSKVLLLYKLRSVYNAFKVGFNFTLEIPEKYSKEFSKVLDPVTISSAGDLHIVAADGETSPAEEVKGTTVQYYNQQHNIK